MGQHVQPEEADMLGLPGSLLTRDPVGAMLYALCWLRDALLAEQLQNRFFWKMNEQKNPNDERDPVSHEWKLCVLKGTPSDIQQPLIFK